MSCLQGHDCLEVLSSRSVLFRLHVFRVRLVKRSCLQGQGCLENMFSRLGLFTGHVFKVRIV